MIRICTGDFSGGPNQGMFRLAGQTCLPRGRAVHVPFAAGGAEVICPVDTRGHAQTVLRQGSIAYKCVSHLHGSKVLQCSLQYRGVGDECPMRVCPADTLAWLRRCISAMQPASCLALAWCSARCPLTQSCPFFLMVKRYDRLHLAKCRIAATCRESLVSDSDVHAQTESNSSVYAAAAVVVQHAALHSWLGCLHTYGKCGVPPICSLCESVPSPNALVHGCSHTLYPVPFTTCLPDVQIMQFRCQQHNGICSFCRASATSTFSCGQPAVPAK